MQQEIEHGIRSSGYCIIQEHILHHVRVHSAPQDRITSLTPFLPKRLRGRSLAGGEGAEDSLRMRMHFHNIVNAFSRITGGGVLPSVQRTLQKYAQALKKRHNRALLFF